MSGDRRQTDHEMQCALGRCDPRKTSALRGAADLWSILKLGETFHRGILSPLSRSSFERTRRQRTRAYGAHCAAQNGTGEEHRQTRKRQVIRVGNRLEHASGHPDEDPLLHGGRQTGIVPRSDGLLLLTRFPASRPTRSSKRPLDFPGTGHCNAPTGRYGTPSGPHAYVSDCRSAPTARPGWKDRVGWSSGAIAFG